MADTPEMENQTGERVGHILVVDDETDILKMVSICLQQRGFLVSTATNTRDAYELIDGNEFDVIITDVMMPGEDGIAFLVRLHRALPGIPVIIMTGHAQLQMAINAVKNGAFDFIHKPFDFSYLLTVIGKAVTFSKLLRMEKSYLVELEHTVVRRTEELKHAMIQLDENHQALMKAATEKNEFMATISHEMRTPMNGVIGGLDLLESADLQGSQREYLLLARQAADNMMEMVERLLSFGTATGRNSHACLEIVDLPVVIESVALDHRKHFAEKGLSFNVQIASDVPRRIKSDGEQISRLLDILLCNAFKFTDKGGALLDVTSEPLDTNKAVIRMTVSDSGIGIPENMIERIFDPFIQVDGSYTRRFGGAGLGLSIARQIAQLLNGTLHVESTPGEGSSFTFTLKVSVI